MDANEDALNPHVSYSTRTQRREATQPPKPRAECCPHKGETTLIWGVKPREHDYCVRDTQA